MSAVRMCDRDGTIFSERSDGWGTFQGTTARRDEHGRQRTVTESLDLCPSCNGGAVQPTAVTAVASVPEAERLADIHGGVPTQPLG